MTKKKPRVEVHFFFRIYYRHARTVSKCHSNIESTWIQFENLLVNLLVTTSGFRLDWIFDTTFGAVYENKSLIREMNEAAVNIIMPIENT
jgi:hypothetical protein